MPTVRLFHWTPAGYVLGVLAQSGYKLVHQIGGDQLPAKETDRLPGLDLLRGLAALAVMLSHFTMYSNNVMSPSAEIVVSAAVEVFFVLSGFVLGPQIMLCARNADWTTLRTFLVRRWMRTIPSYLAALLAISVFFGSIKTMDFLRYTLYMQNLFSQHNANDYYPVAWSLSVEEWYYVSFPIFLLLVGKFVKREDVWHRCLIAALLFVVAIGFGRLCFGDTQDWGASVRRVVVFRIDSIGYGFLLFLFLQRTKIAWDNLRRSLSLLLLVATTATIVVVNMMIFSGAQWPRTFYPYGSALFGMASVLFFLSVNSFLQSISVVCEFLGRISYPMYLFHLVILYLLARVGIAAGLTGLLLYSLTVICCAALFNYGFEQPILANRPRYKGHRSTSAMTAEMSAT